MEQLFDREARRAKIEKYAERYPAVITGSIGRLSVSCPVFEDLSFSASTAEEAFSLLPERIADRIEVLLDHGCVPPMPGSCGKASAQVNMRLSPDEKRKIQLAAIQCGYDSLSEFVRDAAHAGIIETETGLKVRIPSSRKAIQKLVR